jgi:hypothetical protein
MTFQHTGHGCLGVGGILGAFGIHLPEHHSTLQERINEHHERVTEHVNEARDHVNNTINGVHDAVRGALGGGGGGFSGGHPDPGESAWMMGGHPLNLIFGDPVAAEAHQFSLAAIPVGGGVTMSIVALILALAMIVVIVSMVARVVMINQVESKRMPSAGGALAVPSFWRSGC